MIFRNFKWLLPPVRGELSHAVPSGGWRSDGHSLQCNNTASVKSDGQLQSCKAAVRTCVRLKVALSLL